MQRLMSAVRVTAVYTVLLGIVYPFFVIGVGQLLFPRQSGGSLLKQGDAIVGSALIAQEFTAPQYFHSRFSAVDYNATAGNGSSLALASSEFAERITKNVGEVRAINNFTANVRMPGDAVFFSASGLDPHISLANAKLQTARVIKVRGITMEKMKKLINAHTDPDFIGIWGQAGINVLKLNLALDKLSGQNHDNQR